MLIRYLVLLAFFGVWLISSAAQAHFLWVVAEGPKKNWEDASQNEPGVVRLYFSESASPDDPDLLNRIAHAKLWARQGEEPIETLTASKVDDAIVSHLDHAFDMAGVTCTYGVMERGGEKFLLKYSGKTYISTSPVKWKAVSDYESFPLELHPRKQGRTLVVVATWKGEPAADVAIRVSGPGLDPFESNTNGVGEVAIKLPESGLYSIRGKYTEISAGDHEGKAYTSIRHYSTLSLPFNVDQIAQILPPVHAPITSFGGAVLNGTVYAYGGNAGGAHRYVPEEQSGSLYRVSPQAKGEWEEVSTGPRRTGLALVPFQKSVIRIGGFEVRVGADNDLWSTTDVAAFNVETKTWTSLPSLPTARSSFDAAVVGTKIYVVGGWCMTGGSENAVWHETVNLVDLSQLDIGWQAIPQPFKRRAIAVAAMNEKIFVVGGMTSDNKPTCEVEVFDIASNTWSSGPALPSKTAMDGFGTSAIEFENNLYATTMSGGLYRLSTDHTSWQRVAELNEPRFFHRLLALPGDGLLITGGANMSTGKATSSELFPAELLHP